MIYFKNQQNKPGVETSGFVFSLISILFSVNKSILTLDKKALSPYI
jgi:hypothetical protein